MSLRYLCFLIYPICMTQSDALSTAPELDADNDRTSSSAEPRRTGLTKYYLFGMSLSLEAACENDIKSCVGSNLAEAATYEALPCTYCTSALIALKFWKNWMNVNTLTKTDEGDVLNIELKIRYDQGNRTKMLENYEELASWDQSDSAEPNKPMLVLFGPANSEWNADAAHIASKHNKVMLLWSFEYGVYFTKPGPEQATMWSIWKEFQILLEQWLLGQVSRRLGSEVLTSSSDGGECNPMTTDHCFMPSFTSRSDVTSSTMIPGEEEAFVSALNKGWTPAIDYRKSLPGDTTAAGIFSDRQHSRMLQASTGLEPYGLLGQQPCSSFQYSVYPIHLKCNPDSSPYSSTATLAFSANANASVMLARVGTAAFSVRIQTVSTSYNSSDVALEIWSIVVNDTVQPATCLFGQASYCQHSSGCSSPSDYCYTVQGTSISWFQNQGWFELFAGTSLTLDLLVKVVSNLTQAENVLVSYAYSEVSPCPSDVLGCRSCHHYVCSAGLHPTCDGTSTVSCSEEPNPDGAVWDLGLWNVLEINVRFSNWATDPIDQVYQQGARKFVFLHMEKALTGDIGWNRQCLRITRYTAGLNGTSVLLYRIRGTHTLMDDMRFLRAEEPDAFMHCGRLSSAVLFAMSAKAFGLLSKAFIWDRPFGYQLINNSKGFNVNWFMEPLAMEHNESKDCAVFGSLSNLKEEWNKYQSQQKQQDKLYPDIPLDYASMQILAVSAFITATVKSVVPSTLLHNSQWLATYMKTNVTTTFFGDLSFEVNGMRKSRNTATRQYKPVPLDYPGSDEVIRYESANIHIVASDFAYPNNALYNVPGWIEKELQVYPCEAGCVFHTKLCIPCSIGTFRDVQDIDCRPCPDGYYADVIGMGRCRECPEGSICSGTALKPQAKYFAIPIPGNWTASLDNISYYPNKYCVEPNRVLSGTAFEACNPVSVCLGGDHTCTGSNTGLLCGQCSSDETYSGLFQGRRTCRGCLNKTFIIFLCALLGFAYGAVGRIFSAAALNSAVNSADLSCALLRTFLHYCHILGVVKEAIKLDSNIYIAILSTPVDFFIRPLDLIQTECFSDADDAGGRVRITSQGALYVIPVVIGVVIASHVTQGFFGYVVVFLKIIWRSIRSMTTASISRASQVTFSKTGDDLEQAGIDTKGKFSTTVGKTSARGVKPGVQRLSSSIGGGDIAVEGQNTVASDATLGNDTYPKKKKKGGDQEFYQFVGPGAAFVSMHETFALQEHFQTFCRELLVAMVFLYPIVIRATTRVTTCVTVNGVQVNTPFPSLDNSRRVVMDFDMICESEGHKDAIGWANMEHMIVLIAFPSIVLLILLLLRHEYFDIEWRRLTQILHDGHKPEKWYWEVVMYLRTGLIVQVSRIEYLSSRCLFMLLIMIICMCLTVVVKPYEFRDRQVLHFFDLFAMVSVQLTIVAGMVVQYEYDTDLARSWTFDDTTQTIFLVIVIAANLCTVFYGIAALTFNTICLQLQAIIRSSELCVDVIAMRFHRFVQLTFRGMNPVGYYTKHGRHFIDVSKLDEGERKFLVLSLTETMGACFDSKNNIHTWLLENAIHEAFDRAIQARDAQLRALYQRYGGRHFAMINIFGMIKLFNVSLRAPDIPDDSHNRPDTALPRHTKVEESSDWAEQGKAERMGITVEELHNALSSVNVDVLERHPAIHQPRLQPSDEDVKKGNKNATPEEPDQYALTWAQGASLAVFEDFAKTWGSLKIDKLVEEIVTDIPDEQLWNDLQGIREERRTFSPGPLGLIMDESATGLISDIFTTTGMQGHEQGVQIGWKVLSVNTRQYLTCLEEFRMEYPGEWAKDAPNELMAKLIEDSKVRRKEDQFYQIDFEGGDDRILTFFPADGELGLILSDSGFVTHVANDTQAQTKGVHIGWRIAKVDKRDFPQLLENFIEKNLQNKFLETFSKGRRTYTMTFEAHTDIDAMSKSVLQQRILEEQHAMMQEEILQLRCRLREEEIKLGLPGTDFLHHEEAFIRESMFAETGATLLSPDSDDDTHDILGAMSGFLSRDETLTKIPSQYIG